MHADFAFISQAHVAPIVKRYTKYRECAPRFEIATGIVPVEPLKPREYAPLTDAELRDEPVAKPVKARVPHPRELPDDHPDHIEWAAKCSASKLGKSIGVDGRVPHHYKPRLCDCCPGTFTPTSGIQKYCQTCLTLIPTKLLCTPGRIAWDMRFIAARAKREALKSKDALEQKKCADSMRRAMERRDRRAAANRLRAQVGASC